MLLRIPSEEELPNTMRLLKGITSREVLLAYPMLHVDMGTQAFWQKSFGRRPIPEDQLEVVRNYIRTQLDRPLRHAE
jgi:REP element-mobilizing transposase RayT